MEKRVFIENSKGQKLAAVIHLPSENGKFPTIILLHGFTGHKEENHISSLAKLLSENGFAAIRFDASGYGESEGDLAHDYRTSNYLQDIEAVYNFLKSQTFVDPSRIGIMGHSLGGMLAVIFAARHPEIRAVCPVSACSNFYTHYESKGNLFEWKEKGYLEKESSLKGTIKIPFEFMEDSKPFDAPAVVGQIHAPILVIVGNKDINVPIEETKEIFDEANEPKELFEVDGMDHYYKNKPEVLEKVNDKILTFFKATV